MQLRKSATLDSDTALRRRASAVPVVEESGSDSVRISVLVTKDQRRQLKILAAKRGVTISEVVRQGITSFLESEA